jgi:L-glyceraldehyde 3-phosphate reductase
MSVTATTTFDPESYETEAIVLNGRRVVGGIAEGEAMVTNDHISGWGGVDPRTGSVIETRHELRGSILKKDFLPYRDELIISSKAGYHMWPGPYGEWGSRKYLISSCDQSLKRMGLEYVDIFYSHRPDPDTPLEETMGALDQIVRSGKALYAGLSNYDPQQTKEAVAILKDLGTPCLIHQPKYSMLVRDPEEGLLDVLGDEGIGCIPFSPLAQGLLTNKYLHGIPEGSRAALDHGFLQKEDVNEEVVGQLLKLNALAEKRGQSLAQMAIAWLLKDDRITTVLIGASRVSQLQNSLGALENKEFTPEELNQIETILNNKK